MKLTDLEQHVVGSYHLEVVELSGWLQNGWRGMMMKKESVTTIEELIEE